MIRRRKPKAETTNTASRRYYYRNKEACLLCDKAWRLGLRLTMAEARKMLEIRK